MFGICYLFYFFLFKWHAQRFIAEHRELGRCNTPRKPVVICQVSVLLAALCQPQMLLADGMSGVSELETPPARHALSYRHVSKQTSRNVGNILCTRAARSPNRIQRPSLESHPFILFFGAFVADSVQSGHQRSQRTRQHATALRLLLGTRPGGRGQCAPLPPPVVLNFNSFNCSPCRNVFASRPPGRTL